jgi:hypothetical protein
VLLLNFERGNLRRKENLRNPLKLPPSSKTKALESSKKKQKASEGVFDAELASTISLADLDKKRANKAVKKVSVIQHVAPAFF